MMVVSGAVGVVCIWVWLRCFKNEWFYPDEALHWRASGNVLMSTFNPLQLSVPWYFGLGLAASLGKVILDWLTEVVLIRIPGTAFLPVRDPKDPRKKSTPSLTAIDYTFLLLNQVIEFAFTTHLCQYVWVSPLISWEFDTTALIGALPSLFLIFALDDLIYAPTHRFMHWGPVYWFIHKHHHKQKFPVRGYFDAANETPIEQLLGLSCVWVAIQLVPLVTGLHVVTVAAFFVIYAATAVANHTAHDVNLWMGFKYEVRAHEMHHRYFSCNYGQNFMLWDHLMGTFKEYKGS